MRNDKISLLKFIDHWVGGPVCILLTLAYRLCHPLYKSQLSVPAQDLPPKNILIVKFFGLGSLTLSSALIRNIKNAYPGCKVIVMTFKDNVPILNILSIADEILVIDTKNPFTLVASIVRAVLYCRAQKIDVVMDIEFYSKFSTIMSFLSGAKWRMGFYIARLWRNSLINVPVYFNYSRHILEIYGQFATALGIKDQDLYPKQVDFSQAEIDDFLITAKKHSIEDMNKVVGLNIHASDLALCRRWPLPKFVDFSQQFLDQYKGWSIVLTGSKNEKSYTQEFLGLLPQEYRGRMIDLTGQVSLKHFLILLSKIPVFVTNDTGPFHLAKAVKGRTISLWGPGSVDLYGPYKDENKLHDVIYTRYPCSPCLYVYRTDAGFFCGHEAPCMKEIRPQDVMDKMDKYIKP